MLVVVARRGRRENILVKGREAGHLDFNTGCVSVALLIRCM